MECSIRGAVTHIPRVRALVDELGIELYQLFQNHPCRTNRNATRLANDLRNAPVQNRSELGGLRHPLGRNTEEPLQLPGVPVVVLQRLELQRNRQSLIPRRRLR